MIKQLFLGFCMVAASIVLAADPVDEREAAIRLAADGKLEAAYSRFLSLAEAAGTPARQSELTVRAALAAEQLKRPTQAMALAERVPLEPLAAFCRMQLFSERRQFQALWDAYAEEEIITWTNTVNAKAFADLPPISPDIVSSAESVMGNAFRMRGIAANALNRTEAAVRDLRQAADLIPPGYWGGGALAELGRILWKKCDEPEAALLAYQRILDKDHYRWHPTSAALSMVDILLERGSAADAMEVLKRFPLETTHSAWHGKINGAQGRVLEALGRNAEALACYREALTQPPGIGLASAVLSDGERRAFEADIVRLTLAGGGQMILAAEGKTEYQIVLPDTFPHARLELLLRDTAALMQRTFATNGFAIAVVAESERDSSRPSIFLGDTAFARAQGIVLDTLEGWAYVHKLVGRDLIIAGIDRWLPYPDGDEYSLYQRRLGARLGTTKGVTDFLYHYAGVRFLSPYGDTGIAFLHTPTITVPNTLDCRIEPKLRFFFEGYFGLRGAYGLNEVGFYMIANNFLPNTDFDFSPHSYSRAVTRETYGESHPEYFALLGGKRHTEGSGPASYCISNPGFQERVYQDMLTHLDMGFDATFLGHQDSFLPCQCDACRALYDTGDDWGEKLWRLNRDLAERLLKDRPGKTVYISCYGPTIKPPQTFHEFPDNTGILLCNISAEFLNSWKPYRVPKGFISYQYIFGFYKPLAYMPHQSPQRVAQLARELYDFGIKGIFMDGFGHSFGLEGPTYYVYGRMFDDPETQRPVDLLSEYYQSAFVEAAAPMAQFFDRLHHALQFHGDMPWSYRDPSGRWRLFIQNIQDRMRLLTFMYPPAVLADLDARLAQAEGLATDAKVKARLALVRLEFEHLRHLALVANTDVGYRLQPDLAARDRLLDAVASWQEYYQTLAKAVKAGTTIVAGWPEHRPFHGHGVSSQWNEAPFNWDVAEMRAAPPADAARLIALPTASTPGAMDSSWADVPASRMQPPTGIRASLTQQTSVQARYDRERLYLRFEADLPPARKAFAPIPDDGNTADREALDIVLDPFGARERFYRFVVGPDPEPRYDAARGFITDTVHPLFGKNDPAWSADWRYETQRDPVTGRWVALVSIPFAALAVDPPVEGTVWHGNFGRTHVVGDGPVEAAVWSPTRRIDEPDTFGAILFSDADGLAGVAKHPIRQLRETIYQETFEIPEEWRKLKNTVPLTEPWQFQADPMEIGVKSTWSAIEPVGRWIPIVVPAFWAETTVGDYLGTGWYRTRFKLPPDWRGKPIRLLFGAVDKQAWIYVNGEQVREHTIESEGMTVDALWDHPFTAEVAPERLKPNDWNILTIRVYSSRGNAGIWRPVLVQRGTGE